MNLRITLKKMIQKSSVLSIQRTDGSSTWTKLHRGLETHDLAHYAVEKTLKFDQAFYGIIDKGYEINDFAAPKDQRSEAVKPINLHPHALITEHIVNLLEVELMNSGFNENLLKDLSIILTDNSLEFPDQLTNESLTEIRSLYHSLVNKWMVLEDNEKLNFSFTL